MGSNEMPEVVTTSVPGALPLSMAKDLISGSDGADEAVGSDGAKLANGGSGVGGCERRRELSSDWRLGELGVPELKWRKLSDCSPRHERRPADEEEKGSRRTLLTLRITVSPPSSSLPLHFLHPGESAPFASPGLPSPPLSLDLDALDETELTELVLAFLPCFFNRPKPPRRVVAWPLSGLPCFARS